MKTISRYRYKRLWVRLLAAIFDSAGNLLFFWIKSLPKQESFRRILVIRLDQIGDVVLTLPAVRHLKECFPQSEIDFLASPWAEPLLRPQAEISRRLIFENSYFSSSSRPLAAFAEWVRLARALKKKNYDLAIDYRGDVRTIALMFLAGIPRRVGYAGTGGGFLLTDALAESEKHQFERNLDCNRAIGCVTFSRKKERLYHLNDKISLETKLNAIPGDKKRPWIVVHPGGNYASKRWGPDRYRDLIGKLTHAGTVFLIGSGEEKAADARGGWPEEVVCLRGQTSLGEAAALIDDCDLYIGNDSGPAHIAASQAKKTLVLFSGTNAYQQWQPRGERVKVLRHDVKCSPCELRECPLPVHECMEGISVEEVYREAKELLHA